jgi:hypothetical protein
LTTFSTIAQRLARAALLVGVVLGFIGCQGDDVQLRQTCESIVGDAHPEWKGSPIFEEAITACITEHGAGLER